MYFFTQKLRVSLTLFPCHSKSARQGERCSASLATAPAPRRWATSSSSRSANLHDQTQPSIHYSRHNLPYLIRLHRQSICMLSCPHSTVFCVEQLRHVLGVLDLSAGWGTANTALVYHAGRLLALHEGDQAYEMHVHGDGRLQTLGRRHVGRWLRRGSPWHGAEGGWEGTGGICLTFSVGPSRSRDADIESNRRCAF